MTTLSPTTVDAVIAALTEHGAARSAHHIPALDHQQHALQCAALAAQAGEEDELVIAALLHDASVWFDDGGETPSPRLLRQWRIWFSAAVSEPIRLQCDARRYLATVEPGYWLSLPAAERDHLQSAGGRFNAIDAARFLSQPHARAAIRLRRYDEAARLPRGELPRLSIAEVKRCISAIMRGDQDSD